MPVQNLKKLLPEVSNVTVNIEKLAQDKINYLLNRFPTTEWSGTLFYKISDPSHLIDGPLVVTVIDFLLQDVGDATYTKFECKGDEDTYSLEKGYLLSGDVYNGFIHSHHNMDTFFSGTDLKTLETQGEDVVFFFSLIVNHANKYNAKLTLQINYDSEVTTTISCNPLEGVSKDFGSKTQKVTKTKVFFRECTINHNEIEGLNNELETIIRNIEEEKKKEAKASRSFYNSMDDGWYSGRYGAGYASRKEYTSQSKPSVINTTSNKVNTEVLGKSVATQDFPFKEDKIDHTYYSSTPILGLSFNTILPSSTRDIIISFAKTALLEVLMSMASKDVEGEQADGFLFKTTLDLSKGKLPEGYANITSEYFNFIVESYIEDSLIELTFLDIKDNNGEIVDADLLKKAYIDSLVNYLNQFTHTPFIISFKNILKSF